MQKHQWRQHGIVHLKFSKNNEFSKNNSGSTTSEESNNNNPRNSYTDLDPNPESRIHELDQSNSSSNSSAADSVPSTTLVSSRHATIAYCRNNLLLQQYDNKILNSATSTTMEL